MPNDEQYTTAEFAQLIKKKYPEYKDIEDDELVSKIIEKYPEYKDNIISGTEERVLSVLEENKDKNFVKRILEPENYPSIKNDDGTVSSHKMAYGESDGKYFVYPTVIQDEESGDLKELNPDEAFNRAIKSGEYIQFDTEEDAAWFSGDEGYKSAWEEEPKVPVANIILDNEEEKNFQDFIKDWQERYKDKYGKEVDVDTEAYDYRSAWKEGRLGGEPKDMSGFSTVAAKLQDPAWVKKVDGKDIPISTFEAEDINRAVSEEGANKLLTTGARGSSLLKLIALISSIPEEAQTAIIARGIEKEFAKEGRDIDLEGFSLKNAIDAYQKYAQGEEAKLQGYEPSDLEEAAAFGISMAIDSPLFMMGGAPGAKASKLLKSSAWMNRQLQRAGLSVKSSNKLVSNAAKKLNEYVGHALQTSAALGNYSMASDFLTQLEHNDIEDIDYGMVLRQGAQQGFIGFAIAVPATLTRIADRYIATHVKNKTARLAASTGTSIAGFEAEVATFAGLGAAFSEEEKFDGKHFVKTNLNLLAVKAGFALQAPFARSKSFKEHQVNKGIYKMDFSVSEQRRMKMEGEDVTSFITEAKKSGRMQEIVEDPNVAISTKVKLLWSGYGIEYEARPSVADVKMKKVKGGWEVETRNENGDLINANIYSTKAKANEEVFAAQKQKQVDESIDILGRLSTHPDGNMKLENAIISELNMTSKELEESGVLNKPWQDLTKEEIKTRDKFHKILLELKGEMDKETEKELISEVLEEKKEKDDSKKEGRVVPVEQQGEEPGRAVQKPEEGRGEGEAGAVLQTSKTPEGEVETITTKDVRVTTAEEAKGMPPEVEGERFSVQEQIRQSTIHESGGKKFSVTKEKNKWTVEDMTEDTAPIVFEETFTSRKKALEAIEIETAKIEKAPPKKKAKESPAESLLSSYKGITGYFDVPEKAGRRGKVEVQRDNLLDFVQKKFDYNMGRTEDAKEQRRLERQYKEDVRDIKKTFSRDKAASQERAFEVMRRVTHDFISDVRGDLQKVHGNVVPAMLNRLGQAKTLKDLTGTYIDTKVVERKGKYYVVDSRGKQRGGPYDDIKKAQARAGRLKTKEGVFDYINNVINKQKDKEAAIRDSENLEAIRTHVDPTHRALIDKKSQIKRLKDNTEAMKETVATLDEMGRRAYPEGIPDAKDPKVVHKHKKRVPFPRRFLTEEEAAKRKESDEKTALEELERLYEESKPETPEEEIRIFEEGERLWMTDIEAMTPHEREIARQKLDEIVEHGKTKSVLEKEAEKMIVAEEVKDVTGTLTGEKWKEKTPETITDKETGHTIIVRRDETIDPDKTGGIFDWVGNSNWSSILEKMSRYQLRYTPRGETVGVYKAELVEKYDKNLVQKAQIERNKGIREMKKMKVEAFIETYEPYLNEIFDNKIKGDYHKRVAYETIAEVNAIEEIGIPYRSIGTEKTKPANEVFMTTRNELGYWYNLMQNPALEKSLSKTDNPLKRPRVTENELRVKEVVYENTSLGDAIIEAMTPETALHDKLKNHGLRDWSERHFEIYKDLYKRYSPTYQKMFGIPMPQTEFYMPLFRDAEHVTEGVEDLLLTRSFFGLGHNRHLYGRTNSSKKIRAQDMDDLLNSYTYRMEHFRAKAETIKKLNDIWRNKDVQKAVAKTYGSTYTDVINKFIDDFSGKSRPAGSKVERQAERFRRNLMTAALAIKPIIFVKQLTSLPAFTNFIPTKDLLAGTADFVANWKTAREFMNSNNFIRNRYDLDMIDRDLAEVAAYAKKIRKSGRQKSFGKTGLRAQWGLVNMDKIRNVSMFLVKAGDKVPIMAGGWATYKYHLNKGLKEGLSKAEAEKVAVREMESAIEYSQQASDVSDLSSWQRGGPWEKMFTMYATAPMSYHRMATAGLRRFTEGVRTGNTKMMKHGARVFVLNHMVLPVLFQAAANAFRFKDDEKKTDLLRAAILGNINSIFVVGDIIEHSIDKAMGGIFDLQMSPVSSMGADLGEAISRWRNIIMDVIEEGPEEIPTEEWLDALKETLTVGSFAFGIPFPGMLAMEKGVEDVIKGETDDVVESIWRIAGWSEYVFREDEEGKKRKRR